MSDALTWPAVVMGCFTLLNGAVLVPLGRSWKRNRNAGRARDSVIEALVGQVGGMADKLEKAADRTEASMREFGSQLAALNQTSWALKARVDVLETRAAHLDEELKRLRGRRE
jgi:chromosome segregation ATPase